MLDARSFFPIALLLLGCREAAADKPAGASAAPVRVAVVAQKDIPVEVRAIGTAESIHTVQVIPQVGGLIQEVHFKEGDLVKKGQLLFTIDTRPYAASLSAAQAELEKNRAFADQAHRELERFQKLAAEGLTTDLELNQRRASAAALDATVGQNRANIMGSSINVQFAAIRSPIDGRTGTLLVHGGNVVRTNDGRSLVVIRSLQPIYVRFSVPEQFLPAIQARLKEGSLPVEAVPRGASTEGAQGELSFIENSVDPGTGKIDMKGRFANDAQVLWPGQLVDVIVRLSIQKAAVVVPESAVQMGQDGPFAYVVAEGDKASLRLLQVDRTVSGETVVKRGVAPGERVVTDGQIRIRDGASLRIQ